MHISQNSMHNLKNENLLNAINEWKRKILNSTENQKNIENSEISYQYNIWVRITISIKSHIIFILKCSLDIITCLKVFWFKSLLINSKFKVIRKLRKRWSQRSWTFNSINAQNVSQFILLKLKKKRRNHCVACRDSLLTVVCFWKLTDFNTSFETLFHQDKSWIDGNCFKWDEQIFVRRKEERKVITQHIRIPWKLIILC